MRTKAIIEGGTRAVSRTPTLKLTILVLTVSASLLPALGQGTVQFNSLVPGTHVTHVYGPEVYSCEHYTWGNTQEEVPAGTQTYTGPLLTGTWFFAQLWAAPGVDRPSSELRPALPMTVFRFWEEAGTVVPVTATLSGVPADCPVATVQMRVWQSMYSDWDVAYIAYIANPPGTNWLGASPCFNLANIGGDTNSPPYLLGLQSFNIHCNILDGGFLILQHPQNQAVPKGQTVHLSVQVASPSPVSYQWQFYGTNLVGATNSHLWLQNIQPSQAGIYSVRVGYMLLYASSSNATVVVGDPGALSVVRSVASQSVLDWQGVFYLQASTNLAGGFTDLPGPITTSPYTYNVTTGQQFFRLRR